MVRRVGGRCDVAANSICASWKGDCFVLRVRADTFRKDEIWDELVWGMEGSSRGFSSADFDPSGLEGCCIEVYEYFTRCYGLESPSLLRASLREPLIAGVRQNSRFRLEFDMISVPGIDVTFLPASGRSTPTAERQSPKVDNSLDNSPYTAEGHPATASPTPHGKS